jgi:nicotinate-nucleotide--dimethylbenzimidazole phosphoribosyltransferase
MLVFAADHGITEEGVSAYPQEVTRKMVETFANGRAAINILCKTYGIEHRIIDVGVNHEFPSEILTNPLFIDRKIGMGTGNMAKKPAMTSEQSLLAIRHGMEVFYTLQNGGPVGILGLGEVGIGNTAAASAVICAATGKDAALVTGRGAGADDITYRKKIGTVNKVIDLHKPNPLNGFEILEKVGGFEIAAMTGAALAAASAHVPVVLDGLISTAAGMIAALISPLSAEYFIVGHKSVEPGHKTACDFLHLEGIVDLSMRLGEGTGAAICMDLCSTACDIMRDMAGFDDAGIDAAE